jgi:hypothetical protein
MRKMMPILGELFKGKKSIIFFYKAMKQEVVIK